MTDWTPNRRWDPVVWHAAGRWHMVCLAADYKAEGNAKPWFNEDNALERWSGKDLKELKLEAVSRRQGRVWTAPSVLPYHNDVIGLAGWNDHRPHMNQRIEFIDLYSLEVERGHAPPEPPLHLAHKGATSWRDASIVAWDDRWLMTVTTGGFRWGSTPNVWGFIADHPRGPWHEYGPIIDPALSVLFAEFERPQLLRRADGTWAMIVSCWSQRQFIGRIPPVHVLAGKMQFPLMTHHVGSVDAPYGLNLCSGVWCGWNWIDRKTHTSDCVAFVAEEGFTVDNLISNLAGMAVDDD